jgi:hypothetical protein
MKKRTTERNGQPRRELSTQEQTAVELLASGKTDKQTAGSSSLPAERVTKWRLYDPVFQAALNACRAEGWQVSIDRLRSMIAQALDTLAEELHRTDNPDRCKLALDILRLAKLPDIAPLGPADPETIVRQAVNRERQQVRGPLEDMVEDGKGLPGKPSGVTYQSITAPSGWTTANHNGTVTATNPTLISGASASFTLTVLTNNTPGTVNNTVSVGPTGWDNNTANNSASFQTTVESPTSTSITAPTVTFGTDVTVTVTVSSPGGTPTGDVTLTVGNGSPITQSLVNGSSTFTIPDLAAGT